MDNSLRQLMLSYDSLDNLEYHGAFEERSDIYDNEDFLSKLNELVSTNNLTGGFDGLVGRITDPTIVIGADFDTESIDSIDSTDPPSYAEQQNDDNISISEASESSETSETSESSDSEASDSEASETSEASDISDITNTSTAVDIGELMIAAVI